MSKPANERGRWPGRLKGLGIPAALLGAVLCILGAQYPPFALSFPIGLCLLLVGWFTLSRPTRAQ